MDGCCPSRSQAQCTSTVTRHCPTTDTCLLAIALCTACCNPQAAGTSFRCTSCTCNPTKPHFNLTTDLISCAKFWCLFSNYCCRLTNTSLTLPIPARRKSNYQLRDYRLPPQLKRIIPSSGLLCGVRWFDTGVSGLPIGPSSRVNLSKKLNHRAPRNNPEDGRIQTIGRL